MQRNATVVLTFYDNNTRKKLVSNSFLFPFPEIEVNPPFVFICIQSFADEHNAKRLWLSLQNLKTICHQICRLALLLL